MSTENMTPQEEWLAHYGVKGMKWGVRKPTSNDIKDARKRDAVRVRAINAQTDKLNEVASRGGSRKEFAREAKKHEKLSLDYLKNPDRATALRMTTGEKIVNGIIAVGVPGPGTAGVAVGAGVRIAIRKSIERDVAKAQAGKYDSKS